MEGPLFMGYEVHVDVHLESTINLSIDFGFIMKIFCHVASDYGDEL